MGDRNLCFEKVYDIVWKLKKLFVDKEGNELSEWADNVQSIGVREISSFVNGLK